MRLRIRGGQQAQTTGQSTPVKPELPPEELKAQQAALSVIAAAEPVEVKKGGFFDKVKNMGGAVTGAVNNAASAAKGVIGAAATNVGISAVANILAGKRDEAYRILENKVENSGDIKESLKEPIKVVSEFLAQMGLPNVINSLFNNDPARAQEMTESLTITVLGNLARLTVAEGEKVSLSDFADRSMRYLINYVGNELVEIDRRVGDSPEFDSDLFKPCIERLLKDLLNTTRVQDYVLGYFTPTISEKVAKGYLLIKQWVSGEQLESDSKYNFEIESLKPFIEKFATFMMDSVAKKAQDEDLAFVRKLTGSTDSKIHDAVAQFGSVVSPLVQDIIPTQFQFVFENKPELVPAITHTLLLHLMANNFRKDYEDFIVADKRIPLPLAIGELVQKMSGRLADALRGQDVSLHQFATALIRNAVKSEALLPRIIKAKEERENDLERLESLTGESREEILKKLQLSGAAFEQMVREHQPGVSEEDINSFFLHSISVNILKKYKDEFASKTKVSLDSVLQTILRDEGARLSLLDLASSLIKDSLPKASFISTLFERYQDRFSAPLGNLLASFEQKLPKAGEEAQFREQVIALLSGPDGVSKKKVPHLMKILDGAVDKVVKLVSGSLSSSQQVDVDGMEINLSQIFEGELGKNFHNAFKPTIWKSILRMVQTAAKDGNPIDPDQLLNIILDRLLGLAGDKLPKCYEQLAKMQELFSEQDREEKAIEIAKPMIEVLSEIENGGAVQLNSELVNQLVKALESFSFEERQRRINASGESMVERRSADRTKKEIQNLFGELKSRIDRIPQDATAEEKAKAFKHIKEYASEGVRKLACSEYEEAVGLIVKPFVDEMIGLFISDNLERDLPLAPQFKDSIINALRSKLYTMAARGFINSTTWLFAAKRNEERVQQLFAPEPVKADPAAAVKLCHFAGQCAREALPLQLADNGVKWAADLYQIVEGFLPASARSSTGKVLMIKMLSLFFQYLGNSNAESTGKLWNFVEKFVEAAVLKLVAELGTLVDSMEKAIDEKDPVLLEKLLMQMLQETSKHFKVLTKEHKHFAAKNQEALNEAFKREGLLHKGMENAESAKEVYGDWAKKILEMCGLREASNLPAPGFLQENLWTKLSVMLMPMLLSMLFDTIKDPHLINNLLLLAMSSFDDALEGKKKPWKKILDQFFPPIPKQEVSAGPETVVEGSEKPADNAEEKPVEKDQYQKDLEVAMAELVQYVIGSRHSPLANFFLRFKKVRAAIGEASAEPVRGLAHNEDGTPMPFNQFLNTVFKGIIESLDINEMFPKTPDEKRAAEERTAAIKANAHAKATRGLPRVIRQQADIQLQALFYKPWQKFVASMVKFIRKIARSKHEDKAERIMRRFLWGLGRYFLAPLLLFATLPIWLPFRAILHSVLQKQGKQRAEDLAAQKVHANFFYRAFGTLLDTLAEGANTRTQQT